MDLNRDGKLSLTEYHIAKKKLKKETTNKTNSKKLKKGTTNHTNHTN